MGFLSDPVQALIAINVLLTLSLLFPFAAGVWSLGLPGFMAVGAYSAAYASTELSWPLVAAMAIGMMAAMLASLPFGLLALRARGIYLCIATLAAAELILLYFSHAEITGGVMGMTGMPFVSAATLDGVAVAALALSILLYNSRLGKAMIAAGSSPLVASCNGINVPAVQLVALLLGAAFAGLAGGLFAHYYSFISPNNFGFGRTVDILMFLVVGGLTPIGAAVGAGFLTLVPQLSAGLEKWAPAIYGVIVIITMVFLPDGLLPKNRLARLLRPLLRAPRRQPMPRAGTEGGRP